MILDLFCKAGGASYGYWLAGMEPIGVDIEKQPNYRHVFHHGDALELLRDGQWRHWGVSAIHASPPCQAHSARTPDRSAHRDLIPELRELLEATALPYVIENVEGAPLDNPLRLCGTMFPGLRVIRHRLFETNWPLLQPVCGEHPLLYMPDARRPHQAALDEMSAFVSVTGGGNCSVAAASDAMGIGWMTKTELNQAIPPAYTEFIGVELLRQLRIAA